MRRLLQCAVLALLLFVLAAPASARLYLGLDVFQWQHEDAAGREFDDFGARFNVGMPVNRHLYLESRIAFGNEDDPSGKPETKLDWALSTFARPNLPVGRDANLYALIGVSGINVDYDTHERAELQPSLGAGFDIRTGRRLFVGAEYLAYSMKDDFEVSTISINFRWHFQ